MRKFIEIREEWYPTVIEVDYKRKNFYHFTIPTRLSLKDFNYKNGALVSSIEISHVIQEWEEE